jgi:hypothetical protein
MIQLLLLSTTLTLQAVGTLPGYGSDDYITYEWHNKWLYVSEQTQQITLKLLFQTLVELIPHVLKSYLLGKFSSSYSNDVDFGIVGCFKIEENG